MTRSANECSASRIAANQTLPVILDAEATGR